MENATDRCTYSIVVPIYNEEENIQKFYERTTGVMDKLEGTYEIVFINDGSRDNSLELLKELHEKDSRMKVLDLSRNFGKEAAMTAGLDFTIGDAVIPIDADLQDPPEVIPQLVEKWKEGYDVVYATRSKRLGETWVKKATATSFYKVIGAMTKIDIPKNTGDFRLMDRCAINALRELREHHRFMKGLFTWVGFKQIGVPYKRDPRFAGETKWNYWKLFNFAVEGITSFSYMPLKFATFMGVFISLAAFVFAVYVVISTLLFGNEVAGYPSMIVIILFLGGVQLLTIGVIGEYVGRIYDETKQRKLYFIREALGIKNAVTKKQ